MSLNQFLLYCTAEGTVILKQSGADATWEFGDILEAFTVARQLHETPQFIIYNALGVQVLDTAMVEE